MHARNTTGRWQVYRRDRARARSRVILSEPAPEAACRLRDAFRYDGHDVVEVGDPLLLLGEVECSVRDRGSSGAGIVVVVSESYASCFGALNALAIMRRVYRGIPVIFLSNSDSLLPSDAIAATHPEATFTKPVELIPLRHAVLVALKRRL